ncbi:MAG: dethiobiotin synthase [Verrucomicrobia bacterium]|nr:dethiobiotin synthase [Verrucomicrobiota bacterium]
MSRICFVTGTDTGVGKTVLTALLTRYLRQRGVAVAALKPICSGGQGDARQLRAALDGALSLDEINPWHFGAALAPVLAARLEQKRVTQSQVLRHARSVRRRRFDVVLVEGAGGLLSPLGENFDSRDLIAGLGATPIIVGPNRLGVVNQVLLTLEALPRQSAQEAAVVLMSPRHENAASRTNAKLLTERIAPERVLVFPWLPEHTPLQAALAKRPVQRVLEKLAGRLSC